MDLHAGISEVELRGVEEQRLVDFSNTLKLLEEEFRDIEDSREIIMGVLQAAGSYYQADRVYVLEMDVELQIGINTYEWCSEHTSEAIVHSQWIPLELIPRLEQYLKKNKPMIIENISDIQENYPQEYSELLSQGITSMIAAPFSKRINRGFIVVDNPGRYRTDPSMLLLFQYVIVLELNEIKQQRALSMANKRVSQLRSKDVYINMFGKFEVISAQGILNNEDFTAEQGCNLLAYMVVNRRMCCSVGMLCDALWPNLESDDPYSVVRSAVYRLRSTLGCIGLKDLILSAHGTFVLNPEYSIHTDMDRFDALCMKISAITKPENRKRLYQSMMNLYRGSLLCGLEDNHWVLPKASYEKELKAKEEIEEARFRRENPTVAEYCERWLLMQSANIRKTTLIDYNSKVKNYIVAPLGHKYMADITADDVRLAIIPASKKSESVYHSVQTLFKSIFSAAVDSQIIDKSPCVNLSARGGKKPQGKDALTDAQVQTLIEAVKGLPPYVFVMIGLYAGLRREEILALKWDCVHLDGTAPYLSVRRAWHTENNHPVILTDLKTDAAKWDIPLPPQLAACLQEAKKNTKSDYVIANREGGPLSYTQFKRLWQYVTIRSTQERYYIRYVNGQRIKHTVKPVLGEKATHNSHVVYSIDFKVTPHQLRHTYITNLMHASVDPKTVQYLAGHENIKITMDVYAKVKYNRPEQLLDTVTKAFA